MSSFALLVVLVSAAEPGAVAPDEVAPPAPRLLHLGASVGTFINRYSAMPAVRVSVEPSIFRRPLNEFTVMVELGAAIGIPTANSYFTQHYNYTAVAGFAYHSDHSTWAWGFRLGVGAVLYRTTFSPSEPGVRLHFQQAVLGYTEGRGQVSVALGRELRLGLFGGYGSIFYYNPNAEGSAMVGGFLTGLYLDWH